MMNKEERRKLYEENKEQYKKEKENFRYGLSSNFHQRKMSRKKELEEIEKETMQAFEERDQYEYND